MQASPNLCDRLSLTAPWSIVGLGNGSAAMPASLRLVETALGVPSAQFQVSVRSSLPGSVDAPPNGIGVPECPMNVAAPLMLVPAALWSVAPGWAFGPPRWVELQLFVVSRPAAHPLTTNEPLSP